MCLGESSGKSLAFGFFLTALRLQFCKFSNLYAGFFRQTDNAIAFTECAYCVLRCVELSRQSIDLFTQEFHSTACLSFLNFISKIEELRSQDIGDGTGQLGILV